MIPLALEQPGSRFVGVDLAASAVARGLERIAALGLENITLEQGDLSTFESSEPYDYVIAHGVYSWVPPEVQDKLLASIKRLLAPRGLAYVSYATYPGCHLREMVRNLMLFHTARLPDSTDKVIEGLELVRFIGKAQTAGVTYGRVLDQELERMQAHELGYAFHDDFAEHNAPSYFGAFVEHAAAHDLAFFAEGLFVFFDDPRLAPETLASLKALSGDDIVTLEQYLDFVRGRAFRQTLLCHQDVHPNRDWQLVNLRELQAASPLVPSSPEQDFRERRSATFSSPEGAELTTDNPFVKSALNELYRAWPCSVSVAELLRRVQESVSEPSDEVRASGLQKTLQTLLQAAALKWVELDTVSPRVCKDASDRPLASPLARIEAAHGLIVTNLRHRRVRLDDEVSRHFLTLLDGSRNRSALVSSMREFLAQHAPDNSTAHASLEQDVERVLHGMARHALLLQ